MIPSDSDLSMGSHHFRLHRWCEDGQHIEAHEVILAAFSPFSLYCQFVETFSFGCYLISDIFDTVNLSFWGWSIGSSISQRRTVWYFVPVDIEPHSRSEIRGNLGNWTLTHRVKGAVAEVSRSCNTSKKSGLSRSNRSVVLLQSNFKSLKIASAVAPCLCGTSCALSCGDSRHSCSSSSSQQPDLILNYRLEIKIGNVKFNAVKLLEISNSMLISGCQWTARWGRMLLRRRWPSSGNVVLRSGRRSRLWWRSSCRGRGWQVK